LALTWLFLCWFHLLLSSRTPFTKTEALSYKYRVSNLTSIIVNVAETALDLLFPLHCFGCHKYGKLLCASCISNLPRLTLPYCPICAQPGVDQPCRWCSSISVKTNGIRAPFLMEGVIKDAIHALKYRNVRAAAPELGELLAQYLKTHPMPGEVLAPVPLHPRRLRSRGYNQSALLARELGKLSGLPVNERLLSRTKNTPPQVQTSNREERHHNMAGSFECIGKVRGLSVILVDDVTTTGSTLSACAAALKEAGAVSVWGLALAKERLIRPP
jgi:ComF family protein